MIVVLPNIYAGANGETPSLTPEGLKGYDNFINHLTKDLMPYIQKIILSQLIEKIKQLQDFLWVAEKLFI